MKLTGGTFGAGKMTTTEDPSVMSSEEAEQLFSEGFHDAVGALGRFNLAILGDTGVGKSSLVNAIFGDERAKTGVGAPITKGVDYHLSDDETFGVWDFEGFEHGTKLPPIKTLKKKLQDNQRAGNDKAIHVAWFCWDASGARLTDGHRALIEALADAGIPVIGVVTKVHAAERGGQIRVRSAHMDFVRYIQQQDLSLADTKVYPTAAIEDPDFELQTYGLQQLLDTTRNLAGKQPTGGALRLPSPHDPWPPNQAEKLSIGPEPAPFSDSYQSLANNVGSGTGTVRLRPQRTRRLRANRHLRVWGQRHKAG